MIAIISCMQYFFLIKTFFSDPYTCRFYNWVAPPKGPIPFKFFSPSPHRNSGKIRCVNPKKGFGETSGGLNPNEPPREVVIPSEILENYAKPRTWEIVQPEYVLLENQQRVPVDFVFDAKAKVTVEHSFNTKSPPGPHLFYVPVHDEAYGRILKQRLLDIQILETPLRCAKPPEFAFTEEEYLAWRERLEAEHQKREQLKNSVGTPPMGAETTKVEDSPKSEALSGVAADDKGDKGSFSEMPTKASVDNIAKTSDSLPEKPGKIKKTTLCKIMSNFTKVEKTFLKTSGLTADDYNSKILSYKKDFEKEKELLFEEENLLKEKALSAYSKIKKKTTKSSEILNRKLSKLDKSFEKKRLWIQKAYSSVISLCEKKLHQMESKVQKQKAKALLKAEAQGKALQKKEEKRIAKALKKKSKKA